jgi:hypothetical protein
VDVGGRRSTRAHRSAAPLARRPLGRIETSGKRTRQAKSGKRPTFQRPGTVNSTRMSRQGQIRNSACRANCKPVSFIPGKKMFPAKPLEISSLDSSPVSLSLLLSPQGRNLSSRSAFNPQPNPSSPLSLPRPRRNHSWGRCALIPPHPEFLWPPVSPLGFRQD